MFKPVSNKVAFPQMEENILKVWEERGTFEKSLKKNEGKERYKFYDGPPFATGLPHYGHLLAGTIKDIVPRYQTMRGKYVERRFGWDTHGLPIEALAQDALGVAGAPEIRELGIDKFNEQCRSMVLKYVSEWKKTVTRMGRWVDFDHDYKTMNPEFMETIWWVFKQLWNQGRVYKSHRIMPYSWKLSTPLSNFEAGSNYKDVQDPTVTVRVRARSRAEKIGGGGENAVDKLLKEESMVYLLIWTTTPWTLPENLMICAGADIDYVAVRDVTDEKRPVYVMAKARLPHIFKKEEQYELVAEFKGSDLKGTEYEPIFPYFADKKSEGAFRVLNDVYVTTDDGVGLVHIAPAYGEDDFRVCKEAGMDAIVDPLGQACAFTDQVPEYKGRFCKDCDKDIIKRLKAEGKLVHQATITHSYPFCDRTDTPLIYRAIDAWYVKVEDLHERLAKNNAKVHWTPAYVGEKRFGNWLEEARDWNISRNRFWGSCIPVWINDADPDDMICVGSIKELEELSGEKVTDLHKHFVDKVVIKKDGKTYHRTPEVLDCWFESGSMPYAQAHYMGQREVEKVGGGGEIDKIFPADFIAEGLDQTRGWFYTLMVLGTCLFDQSPYKNVIVNGLVLAEDGKKMSKRLKNYPDPTKMLDTYGADAIRLYMIYSPVVKAESLKFSEKGVQQLMRDLLIPWWNAYSFFVTYANVDGFADAEVLKPSFAKATEGNDPETFVATNVLDRWIVSSMETLINDVTAAMDDYDLQKSVRPFVKFVEDLTNWYIRRSRRRFWKSTNDGDKLCAYRTLRYVLVQLAKVAAPFTPFIAEEIYTNLKGASDPESVHLCDFPTANAAARDLVLEKRMADVMTAVELGRRLRADNDLKVRQPLAALKIAGVGVKPEVEKVGGGGQWRDLFALITDELNVKEVEVVADETELCQISFKANFKTLGKKCGAKMKAVAAAIAALPSFTSTSNLRLNIEGIDVDAEDVVVTRSSKPGLVVASQGAIVVGLETALNPELIAEGNAREFVSHVQAMRKEADFEVTQRIVVTVAADTEMKAALAAHLDYVKNETLATEVRFAENGGVVVALNGHETKITVEKV